MSEVLEQAVSRRELPAITALTDRTLEQFLLPPDRVGSPSSWWGHVPFAHWLVRELAPRLIVELGTHHGVSFSAFCNSVQHAGLETRCYAIDTWQGDEHAGLYDESVFSSLSESVQQKYSGFATLVRRTFDSALELFADGSIDLLHIDGLHTYEAVKADYEAWRPKLSARAVVLFHDTCIFERNFGVWRLWKEVSEEHPAFEFYHSCGLGVLAPGRDVPSFIVALTKMDSAVAATLRHWLAELGERWISVDERTRATSTIDILNRDVQTNALQRQQEMQLYGEATESARLAIAALHEEVIVLRESMTVLADASTAQEAQLADIRSERDVLREELAAVTQHAERLTAHLEQVRTSTSWRVTGPYRVAGRLLKRRIIAPLQRPRQWRGCRQISRSGVFNASFYLGRESAPEAEEDVIMDYLAASQSGRPWGLQNPGMPQRRPVLGFHQLSYATHCDTFDELAGEDPLVHYLRTGQPDGPWKHPVITAHRPAAPPAAGLRILIHAHFHYPDLLDDLLSRLAANASPVDLLITTTSQAKAASIQRILATRDRTAKVVTVPNRGRDIGALLMHSAYLESYDVIGHLHGKRSPQQSAVRGNNWREFLWDHLVGCAYPMADVIAEAFAADERLGLIFPEDPNLNHWDQNHDLAHAMAERMLLADALPSHFEFPKGTMFWARVAALRPLLDLGWEWDDFPDEPIESDGTVLHTLERMIPFAAVHAGFSFKTTHVPHSWRLPEQ